MKLPRKLWIGESEWKTKFLKKIDDAGWLGYCDVETQTLEILTGLKPRERLAIFIHEVLHAIEDEYGFELNHKMLNTLAYGIADIIIDNFI